MAEELGRALSWDEPIDNTPDDEFVLFDAGDYPFEVTKIERATFNGSAKMAASPMAKLTLKLTDPTDGRNSYAFYNLILNAKVKYRIKEFFVSLGLTPENAEGDTFAPCWNAVVGACGWLHMEHREYNGNTYADVKKCLKPSEVAKKGLTTTSPQNSYTAPVAAPVATQTPVAAPVQAPAATPVAAPAQAPAYSQQQMPLSTAPVAQPVVATPVPAGVPIQQVSQQATQMPPAPQAPAAPAPGVF